jgi:recombinational DNA repair ATPase RecF
MIRLDRVELLHWDIQQHQMLPFSRGVIIITGENGSGKTSILDAIKIGLGVVHPSAERRVEDYLLPQAKPVVMVRLLVDNRRDPQTGRRPFDPLGAYGQDVVTMAVVFKAVDENEYSRDYYILDGDHVPLVADPTGAKPRPLASAADYRARLKKVGIGPRYLKLLRLPQGQVAQLCAMNSEALFDYLFDIIGGRTVLEEWEARLGELGERQRDHDAVQATLKKAREDLDHLARKVDRFRDFEKYKKQADACDTALPHRRRKEAALTSKKLESELETAEESLRGLRQRRADALTSANRAAEERDALDAEERRLKADISQSRKRHVEHIEAAAQERATLAVLAGLKRAADGVPYEDIPTLQTTSEELRATIAAGDAEQQQRENESRDLKKTLDTINRGLVPLPEVVEQFRRVLRQAGIPHHVLAEVVEISDADWSIPIEGYLDRLRFAILVQDPNTWQQAAALVRRHRYPYGVLAPDIRGASPADKESLASVIEIKEARYRSLLARMLRRVFPKEPETPLSPAKGGRILVAPDGFVLSRTEARHPSVENLYLGRRALEIQKARIEARLSELDVAAASWQQERKSLHDEVEDIENRIARQRRRLEWEANQARFAVTERRVAEAEGAVFELTAILDSLEAKRDACRKEMERVVSDLKVAEDRARTTSTEIEQAENRERFLVADLKLSEERLGRFNLEALPQLTEEAEALTAESSVEVLVSMQGQLSELLAGFREDEQDPMLPVNHRRQQEETGQVATRLEQLQEELMALKEAAERAHEEYLLATRRVFRAYFARLKEAAEKIDFFVDGRLEQLDNGRFRCDVKVGIGDKTPVHHDSQSLSGGQKAALSILMGMTAVALEEEGAGFFLIDEPFSNSDLHKINELGRFLDQTGAQYLVSMPTTADLDQCGDWLKATWICTRSRGGVDPEGRPVLAEPLKICFAKDARSD